MHYYRSILAPASPGCIPLRSVLDAHVGSHGDRRQADGVNAPIVANPIGGEIRGSASNRRRLGNQPVPRIFVDGKPTCRRRNRGHVNGPCRRLRRSGLSVCRT